jgi:RNA ligase (TIGR02306 family)
MAEVIAEVVRIQSLTPIEGADKIELAKVFDYPVVVQKGQFKVGDLAIYIPVDAVVPFFPVWSFLHQGSDKIRHRRINPRKFMGQYSLGVLQPLPWEDYFELGQDVTELFRITKYEPAAAKNHHSNTESARITVPGFWPYTDIQHHRRYGQDMFELGETVIITEKIHGRNLRCGWINEGDTAAWVVGSHNSVRLDETNPWTAAVNRLGLKETLALFPKVILYGELYGPGMQAKYDYGISEPSVAFFDVYEGNKETFMSWTEASDFLDAIDVIADTAPVLYEGAYDPEIVKTLAQGPSVLGGGMPREGVVVRPLHERKDRRGRRVLLKEINPEYALSKGNTEEK